MCDAFAERYKGPPDGRASVPYDHYRPLSAGDCRPAPATDRVLDDGRRANVWHAPDSAICLRPSSSLGVTERATATPERVPLNAGSKTHHHAPEERADRTQSRDGPNLVVATCLARTAVRRPHSRARPAQICAHNTPPIRRSVIPGLVVMGCMFWDVRELVVAICRGCAWHATIRWTAACRGPADVATPLRGCTCVQQFRWPVRAGD
jgi:hypothetical protein